ncbi:protein phosphatase 1 regulatory subunit 16A [Amblyraja radiata]|uniref:protein phosphatase 1 regulatory subunit 16A n=1 Tax=Amblyraja radiata TaxID=386614 RepID=UPI00140252F9|nr:protein phosphatase 1 regulatory subunit 16A [Amblyraja radiata]
MAEHSELLAEMPLVGRMTTHERLRHAHKRRGQQLKKWAQCEKEAQGKRAKLRRKSGNRPTKRIRFPDNVRLLEAASRNDAQEVGQLLQEGISADLYNEDGLTALHQCCIDDYAEVVTLLLEGGGTVNACDSELWTPLHAAATCGHLHLVQQLIQHGADLMAVNADGNMPYDLCEDEVTLECLETAMAQQGVTQEKIDESRMATERLMVEDIGKLVEAKSDLNSQNEVGACLLHVATANGFSEAAELLLTHKARVDVKDSDGWEPLHAAACWGQVHMVEMLVGHGANLNARSFLDETPLDVCGDEDVRTKLLELKHQRDAVLRSQDRHRSALQRRTSSAGSRGKVVRKVSVTERSNLYRREHRDEARAWHQAVGTTPDDEPEPNIPPARHLMAAVPQGSEVEEASVGSSGWAGGEPPLLNGAAPGAGEGQGEGTPAPLESGLCQGSGELARDLSHHTLADLKRQRAASKLQRGIPGEELPIGGGPDTTPSHPPSVYCTPASGDPPLVRFKEPVEEAPSEKSHRCCRMM